MADKRDTALDLLRGTAIIIVVFGHAMMVSVPEGTRTLTMSIIQSFQMPLMFLVSGFTIDYVYPSPNIKRFLIKKIKRLLIPYLVWETFHYIICCILVPEYKAFCITGFFREIMVSDFWFLRELFVLYLIVGLCNFVYNKQKKVQAKMIILLSLPVTYLLTKLSLMNQSVSLWYTLWFVGGYYLSLTKDTIEFYLVTKMSRPLVFLGGVFVILLVAFGVKNEYLPNKEACTILCFLVLVMCYKGNEMQHTRIIDRITALGKNTLPIYAIHWCILFSVFWRMEIYNILIGKLPSLLTACCISGIWLAVCQEIIFVLKRSKWSRKLLLGEK